MTCNIGSDILLASEEITEKIKEQVNKILHQKFRPEFLNRIDAIVFFKSLTPEDIEKITKIQLQYFQDRLMARNITLTFTDKLVKEIAKNGYSKEFGARPIKREIQNFVYVPVSQFLLRNQDIKSIKLDVSNGVLEIISESEI